MDYDPRDYIPTGRQVLAAWVVCLGIAGAAVVGLTVRHPLASPAAAGSLAATAGTDSSEMEGVEIPRFALCRPPEPARSAAVAQQLHGPISLPIDHCS